MANRIKIKRSTVPGRIPEPSDLEVGELAVNTADGVIYTKHSNNNIVTISSATSVSLETATTVGNTSSRAISITSNTASTSTTTGALTVSGGVGIEGNLYAAAVYVDSLFYSNGAAFTGNTGFTGSAGENGYIGSAGANGFTGSAGAGFTGSSGYTGSQGIQGATGPQGLAGEAAAIGYTGSQGVQGATGPQGLAGEYAALGYTGSRGDLGYAGSAGPIGFTGSRGDQAPNFVLTSGDIDSIGTGSRTWTVSKDASNSAYQVGNYVYAYAISSSFGYYNYGIITSYSSTTLTVNVLETFGNGTYGGWQFVFTAREGYTGSRGTTGFNGSQGDIGYTGSRGAYDSIGFTGSQGDIGYTGSIGFTGSRGAYDAIGFTGSQGDLGYVGSVGFTGSRGAYDAIGFTGSQGSPGEPGYTGSAGAVGFTGSAAIGFTGSAGFGFTGSAGVNGFTGSAGPSGFAGNSNIYNGKTTVGNTATLVDTISVTGVSTVRWTLSSYDSVNNKYKSSTIDSLNNGSSVYYNEYSVVLSDNNFEVAAFSSNISNGNISLYALGDSSNVAVTYQRTVLGTSTLEGYVTGVNYIQNTAGAGFTGSSSTGFTGSAGATGSPGIATSSLVVDRFTGNGVQSSFSLSVTPTGINQTIVVIDGVTQIRDTYSLASNVVTFTEVPADGAIVEVTIFVYGTANFVDRSYTGDGTTSSFAVTSGVTDLSILVTDNGTVKRPTADYTVSGNTITFVSAPSLGSNVHIREIPAGLIGYTGSAGSSGSQGSLGYTGSIGFTGSRGAYDAVGFTGSQGAAGSQGNLGYTGSQGIGFTGSAGTGFTGSQGSNGSTGFTGSSGTTGFTGSAGEPGSSGSTGFTGSTGSQGTIGYTGSSGLATTYATTTVDITATVNTTYLVDTTTGNVTITLPGSPAFGQTVGVIDGAGTAGTNQITVLRNGNKIQGLNTDLTVNTDRAAFTLVYFNSANGWVLTSV